MPKRNLPKKRKRKTTKAIAVKKESTLQELVNMFAGSSSLVKNDDQSKRELILRVAEAFEIPATCVNIMGGLPYINKDGLLFKLEEYEGKEVLSLETKMIQYSLKSGERAIAEASLVLKNGRSFNAIGEADEMSIKLSAVKATPNMMAETRAQNRVIRRAIQARMLRNLYTKLGGKKNAYDGQEKNLITNALSSSSEEMTNKEAENRIIELSDKATERNGKIKPTPDQVLKITLERIKEVDDPITLEDYRERVKKSGLYSEIQKVILYKAIDKEMKKYV